MNLNQVTLPCHDLEASVSFYRLMGFTQIVSNPPTYARFECESGVTFSLHLMPTTAAESGVVVYFETANLDDTVRELKEKGLSFQSDPADQPWLWREAYLNDPAGNTICLYSAGHNRRNPPWSLSS